MKIGATWVHLRTCQTCGGTRCCDNSPNRHATKHARASGHPVIASVPEPAGFKEAAVQPSAAYYHKDLGEFILPYEAVRTMPDPSTALTAFIHTTYERAATLAGWDRAALERRPLSG